MNGKYMLISMSMFFALCGATQATAQPLGGVMQFGGAIYDSSCRLQTGKSPTLEFNNCPGGLVVEAFSAQPAVSVYVKNQSNVNARAIADGSSKRYRLVDSEGKAVQSGSYWVVVALP